MVKINILKNHFKQRIIELERSYRVIKESSPKDKHRLNLIKDTLKINMEMYKHLKGFNHARYSKGC